MFSFSCSNIRIVKKNAIYIIYFVAKKGIFNLKINYRDGYIGFENLKLQLNQIMGNGLVAVLSALGKWG